MQPAHYPKLVERVQRVHAVIGPLARSGRVSVQPASEEIVPTLCRSLRQNTFRKPLLTPASRWLPAIVLRDPIALAVLAENTELALERPGGQWRWKPWGMLVHPLTGLPPEVVQRLLSRLKPCHLTVHLGNDARPFTGLLDGVSAIPDVA